MSKRYIFVESTSKAKLIGKWLPDYVVVACKGHLKDIIPKKESIKLVNNEKVEVSWDNSKLLSFLKGKVNTNDSYGIATDNDREGERIALDLHDELITQGASKVYRIRFNEITRKSILRSITKEDKINFPMAKAAQARSIIDFYLGFNGSEKIWKILPGAKSIGRIQCPSISFLTEVYDSSILKGVTKELRLTLSLLNIQLSAKVSSESVNYLNLLQDSKKQLESNKVKVKVNIKFFKSKPLNPLNTASLLNELNRKFGYGLSKSMSILQALYDGSAEENSKFGLITYMRTDSISLNPEWCKEAEKYITKSFSANLLCGKVKREKTISHEAIRPTSLSHKSIKFHKPEFEKVYNYIKARTLAHFFKVPEGIKLSFELNLDDKVKLKSKDFFLLREQGYEAVLSGTLAKLPRLSKDKKIKINHDSTERSDSLGVTEGRLIKYLESNNIGRPSTWYSLPKILKLRGYILDDDTIKISPLGRLLTYYLKEVEPQLVSSSFTSNMEKTLDKISQGKDLNSNVVLALKEIDSLVSKMTQIELPALIRKLFKERICKSCNSNIDASYNRFKGSNYLIGYVCKECRRFSHIDSLLEESNESYKILRIHHQRCKIFNQLKDSFMTYQEYWNFVKGPDHSG